MSPTGVGVNIGETRIKTKRCVYNNITLYIYYTLP